MVFRAIGVSLLLVACAGAQEPWKPVPPVPDSVTIRSRKGQPGVDNPEFIFHFESTAGFQKIALQTPRTPARLIDEFRATVRIRALRRGIRAAVRLVVPAQNDPRTGRPLVTFIEGDAYVDEEEWQTLSVRITDEKIKAQARLLRAQLSRPNISLAGGYANGIVLLAEANQGSSGVEIGATSWGPVIAPSQIVTTRPVSQTTRESRLRVDRDQVIFKGRSVFPVMIPDHGESPDLFRQLRTNVIWVPNLNSVTRMQSLIDRDFAVMATPPHPQFDPGDFRAPLESLPPLDQTAAAPDLWYLGTGIRDSQIPHLLAWAREVRSADRLRQRPLIADLVTGEGVASRLVDSVGISQNAMSSFRSFGGSRNRAFVRQNASAQVTLPWQWIQTEHSADYVAWREKSGMAPAYVEPEQILMQFVSALSAGARGIGFWKTKPLNTDNSRDRETARAIELSMLYLAVIEPLLIDGQLEGHVKMVSSKNSVEKASFLRELIGGESDPFRHSSIPGGPDAAVINSGVTSLIIAGYWDTASQFVPQQMYSAESSLVTAAAETASAWEISPTMLRGFRRVPAPGGLRLSFSGFDMLTMALVTSDLKQRAEIQQRIADGAPRAARLFLELTRLKADRVARTCQIIDSLQEPDERGRALQMRAQNWIAQAESALASSNYRAVEEYSRQALKDLRTIQTRYWYRAVQDLPTPAASPHAVSFSTLPDHWRLMNQVRASSVSQNLIPSGSFEADLESGEWIPVVTDEKKYHAGAEVVSESSGNKVLRMRTWARSGRNVATDLEPALLVQCPEIEVSKGDVLEITGRIRAGHGVHTSLSAPLLIFDSDLGPECAVSPHVEPDWQTFRIMRQASESGPFKVWLALKSPAEVLVDDLSVSRLTPLAAPTSPISPASNRNSRSQARGAGYSRPIFP